MNLSSNDFTYISRQDLVFLTYKFNAFKCCTRVML